jgi:hypothetical protein
MKTAVEWLIDEHFGGIENCTPDFRFHIQQAKEMEKEQIEKAIDDYFIQHIRRTTTMHEVIIKDVSLLDNMIENGDIICFDDSKHEKKYDDLKERNGRFG